MSHILPQMNRLFAFVFLTVMLLASSCSDRSELAGHDDAEATIANESGTPAPLPKDVLYASRALISGKLYARPNFEGTVLAHFDTSQQLHIIDTTDNIFVKARLPHDTSSQTGYIPRAILPERQASQ